MSAGLIMMIRLCYDIEIAHKAQMKPIMDIAQNLGIDPDDVNSRKI